MFVILTRRLRLNKVFLKPQMQNRRDDGVVREGFCHEGKIFSSWRTWRK